MSKKTKKVYCKDCKYCGDLVYYTHPSELSHMIMPLNSLKNYYGRGIEIEQRYCNNPDVPTSEEFDTFYTNIKNNYTPLCHEVNKNNNCKYFKRGSKK